MHAAPGSLQLPPPQSPWMHDPMQQGALTPQASPGAPHIGGSWQIPMLLHTSPMQHWPIGPFGLHICPLPEHIAHFPALQPRPVQQSASSMQGSSATPQSEQVPFWHVP